MADPGHCSSPMQLSPHEQSVVKAVAAREAFGVGHDGSHLTRTLLATGMACSHPRRT
jgi:hypothetical protein